MTSPPDPPPSGEAPTFAADDRTLSTDGSRPAASNETFPEVAGYRIIGRLGEGGMGIVYEAEQQQPFRRVALKVIRGGAFVDASRIRMFQREADTLARLKHPNIGAIYESGRSEDGRHFFAMELVSGPTLDRYLAQRGPAGSREEMNLRLALFRQIADAVQYAHQRGVIHRDLKPSNIVVSSEGSLEPVVSGSANTTPSGTRLPQVKILDFGLARITDGDMAMATQVTEIGAIKGTLAYMSPEQARGDPSEIDLRADVYALGVILYEMLSGRRPYDVAQKSLIEAVRVICEEPAAPLHSSLSGMRRLDPDLQTIVGKAMEKEAGRRYASAGELAEDVARYLASQPILARPPSRVYLLRKFAARNKALVAGTVATFIMLIVAVVGTTSGLIRARRAQAATEKEYASAQRLSAFMTSIIGSYDVASMGRTLRSDLTGILTEHRDDPETINTVDLAQRLLDKEILRRAVATIEKDLADDPALAARAHGAIGDAYYNLQLFEPGLEQLLRAKDLIQHAPDASPEQRIWIDHRLGDIYRRLGGYAKAESAYEEAIAILHELTASGRAAGESGLRPRDLMPGESAGQSWASWARHEEIELRSFLGDTYRYDGRFEKAARLLTETLADARKSLGGDDPDLLTVLNNLSLAFQPLGRSEEALKCLEEAMAKSPRVHGAEHGETLIVMSNLANQLRKMRRFQEAETTFDKTIEVAERTKGSAAWITLMSRYRLGLVYRDSGRVDRAERLLREIIPTMKAALGDGQDLTVSARIDLADLLGRRRRFDEARGMLLENLTALGASTAPGRAGSLYRLARIDVAQADKAAAMKHVRESIDAGLDDATGMSSDPSLASLHGPQFDALVARARRNSETRNAPSGPGR